MDVNILFDWKAPAEGDPPKYAAVRAAALQLARVILTSCPDTADRTTAIYHARMAWFMANESLQGK
jgi:hypothetical protein